MKARQGILFLLTSLCLSANIATANDSSHNKELSNASDLAKLSEEIVITSTPKNSSQVVIKFAGKLRTSIEPKADKVAANKAGASKAMLSKFRINGI